MDYKLIRKERIYSTNNYLSELTGSSGISGDAIVVADYQTHGRGQGDHGWESEPGENILMSWLIHPAFLSASDQFMISKAVSLALIDHLHGYTGNTYIKWPNDILVGTAKIAGILIEHSIIRDRIARTIAGIGLNVNQSGFPVFEIPATSLYLLTGRQYDLEKQMRKLVRALYNRFNQLREGRTEELNMEYLEHLFRFRQKSVFKSEGGHFKGTIEGVNEYGQLLVRLEEGMKAFNYGEIKLIID